MRLLPFVLLAAVTTNVHADETFKAGDYEIIATDRAIDVRKGKRRAILISGDGAFGVSATVDAKAKKVTIKRDYECSADESTTFTFDELEARLVNTEGVSLHLKKNWAGSAKSFAQAVKLDAKWNLAGYNLASALTRLGKLDEANAALAPWFSSAPIATYIQVSLDPDLQPLLATKAVAAVRGATKPGTAKVGENGLRDDPAYSADRGWLAVHHSDEGYLSCGGNESITIFEIKTGKELGSIPLGSIPSQGGGPCGNPGRAAIAKAKAARLAKAAIAQTILVGFGFAKVSAERVSVTEDESGKRTARLSKAKLGVVLSSTTGNVNVLRGNTSIASGPLRLGGNWVSVAYAPGANAMVFTGYVPSDMCARTDEAVMYVPDSPPAKK